MNYQFQIYQAHFNYIGNILIKEYETNKNEFTSQKIKCVNQMYMFTNNLNIEHNILLDKYNKETFQLEKQIQKLKKENEELHNTIRFTNLGSSRFGDKDAR